MQLSLHNNVVRGDRAYVLLKTISSSSISASNNAGTQYH